MADVAHSRQSHNAPAGPAAPPTPDTVSPDQSAPTDRRWQELRSLVVGPERTRLDRVERKLNDPGLHVGAVSDALPEAVARRSQQDGALADALGPVVGSAIKASVRADPQPLVDAIFPIIGPAIRRAIAAAFGELVQSVNTSLEHSFTPRGLAWRFEAMRTGRSFGEVVLRHSLLYRVEQLFVIHRDTGLLIKHVTASGVQALAPDMVAGMLTAIGDFARDSFEVSRQDGLDSVALGDLTVLVERGPTAALAAVVRGQPPTALRETMQRATEDLHRVHAAQIDRFALDGVAFAVHADILEPCLVSRLATPANKGRWRLWLLGALTLGLIGWCAVPRVRADRQFNAYVNALRQEPGIVIGDVRRVGGRHNVSALRDPLARDPAVIRSAFTIDSASISEHWESYIALRPEFVLKRATLALTPPATVQLAIRGDTLVASGVAPQRWRDAALQTARAVAGVGMFDVSSLSDSVDVALRTRAAVIEQFALTFTRGDAATGSAARATLDTLAAALRQLIASADLGARVTRIDVWASSDSSGSDVVNQALRQERAQSTRRSLIARGVPATMLLIDAARRASSRSAGVRIYFRPLTP